MKNKIKYIIVCLLIILIPYRVEAISKDYVDKVSEIVNITPEENKITLYLFYGEGCPHCAHEKEWLETIKDEYGEYINIELFEVWKNTTNSGYMETVKQKFNQSKNGVPFTVIGEDVFVGFSNTIQEQMEKTIKKYINEEVVEENTYKIPILGNINAKKISLSFLAVVLGLIDGFNPCAMWILLFLINMLIGMKNKKRRWILGITFLLTSAIIYFLSMLGITFVLSATSIVGLRYAIALVAITAGIINIRNYINERKKETGCTVVNNKKRKNIINKIKKLTQEKSFLLSLIGTVTLAASVNLIELACSLGFPLIFTEILAINEVTGTLKIIYLIVYIIFYLLDDVIVFVIAMKTLEVTGFTTKYSKYTHLIGGILMILMGLLLALKYEWLTLNF